MACGANGLRGDQRPPARLPRQVRALDFGALDRAGGIVSLGRAEEFFVLKDCADGRAYEDDLVDLVDGRELTDRDTARCDALCDWLLGVHCDRGPDASLYARRLRALLGEPGGIMGLADGLASVTGPFSCAELEQIERGTVSWRWRIRERAHRLRRVHGDLRPANVLFREGCDFAVLGRGPGEWGEPVEDVASLTLHFVLHGVHRPDAFEGALKALFRRFWARYLEGSRDGEMLEVAPPFLAHRALDIVARTHPEAGNAAARRALARFVIRVLGEDVFDPERIDEYLAG
jgi:Ser/Thr protein kinase RdoA (MazF antagonist)